VSYTVLSAKVVTSRKSSQCTWCLNHFPAGTMMQKISAVMDGHMDRWSYCPTCHEMWKRDMGYGDEITPGDINDARWEEIRAEIGAPRGSDRAGTDAGDPAKGGGA
jgi:hypothetical protein